MSDTTLHDVVPTPVGDLLLVANAAALTGIRFDAGRNPPRLPVGEAITPSDASTAALVLRDARRELEEYFAGARTTFTIPLAPRGTAFQERVWRALREVPYGETVSYLALTRRLGDESAVRAVAAANARNPLPIVVPCHRVVGADGSLVGFGGGLDRKRWLLAHEQRHHPLTLSAEPDGR
jgi:methylated-DNA-[protein]-cysteine S-methyltransferase